MVVPYIGVAGAIKIYDDTLLLERGCPLIAATFILGCAGSALRRLAPGMRLYPRQLRLRLELEEALFRAKQAAREGAGGPTLAERLRSAQRLALRSPLGERIARLAHILASGEPEAAKTIADELGAIVRELPPRHGERFPLRRIGMLPGKLILPASAAIAFAGAAIGQLSPAAPVLSIGGLLVALLFFGLAHAGLMLVMLVSLKIHDIRSKAGFRTILVTDKQRLTKMGATAASSLYWKIGHLVMIFGDGEFDEGRRAAPPGAYRFFLDRSSFTDALTAYADHTDIILLDTRDETLAAEVLALTRLPPARYLALSEDGVVPPGFRWVDPRTLFILPSDLRAQQADGDPYSGRIRGNFLPWEDRSFLILLFASAFFAFVERGEPLALFLGVAAFCQTLPDRLGPRRRASISRSMLRAPHSPEASRRLVPRQLERRLWIGTGLIGLAACVHLAWPILILWLEKDYQSLLKLIGLLWIVTFSGNSLVYAGLILRKWWVDWHFRILVLRRNSRTFGYGHKISVMATCGKYGQVISLQDYSLDRTDDDYGEWRESPLGNWFRIFSEIGSTLKPDAFLHMWKRQVLIELETVDFAVFDWIEEVTDNMKWELAVALERLPGKRMLVICSPENEANLTAFLAPRIAPGADRPRSLLISRKRDDQYIWARHDDFDRAFSLSLHQTLTDLVTEPRKIPERVISGAWAYPQALNKPG